MPIHPGAEHGALLSVVTFDTKNADFQFED